MITYDIVFKATAENDLERATIEVGDEKRLFCNKDILEIAENIFLKFVKKSFDVRWREKLELVELVECLIY